MALMSVEEWRRRRTQEQQKPEVNTATAPGTASTGSSNAGSSTSGRSSGGLMSVAEWRAARNRNNTSAGRTTSSNDLSSVQNWLNDSQALLGEIQGAYGSWNTDDDEYEGYRSRISNNLALASGLRNQYAGNNDVITAINEAVAALDQAQDYAFQNRNYYSQFGGAEEYQSYLDQQQEYYDNWGYYADEADYDRYSVATGSKRTTTNGLFGDPGDTLYDFINDIDGYRDEVALMASGTSQRNTYGDYQQYSYMTDDQIGVYNYLYATQGKDKAEEYLAAITSELNRGIYNDHMAWVDEQTEKHPWLMAPLAPFAGVVGNTVSAIDLIGQNINRAITGEAVDYYSANQMAGASAERITENVANSIDSDFGRFLYTTANSGVESLFASAVGGQALGGIMLGAGAAASTARDIAARGGTDNQALFGGIAAGVFEGLFESLSIGNFKALKEVPITGVKDFALNALKSIGVNASEEMATEVANIVFDTLAMGDISNWDASVQAYMDAGEDKSQATRHTIRDMILQVLEAGASGALMGAGFSAIGSAGSAIESKQYKDKYGDSAAELADEALELDPSNALAKKVKGKLDAGKKVTGGELRGLVQQNDAAILDQDMVAIREATAARLEELGETGDVQALAMALTNQARQQSDYNNAVRYYISEGYSESEAKRMAKRNVESNLSREERNLIANSKYGQRVANELNAENISSGQYSTAWAEQIDTNRINVAEYSRLVSDAQMTQETTQTVAEGTTAPVPQTASVASTKTVTDTNVGSKTGNDTNVPAKAADAQQTGAVTIKSVSKKYGTQAQALVTTYNLGGGNQDVAKFDAAYKAAYTVGKELGSLSYVMNSPATAYLTSEQKELAYDAGVDAAGIDAEYQRAYDMGRSLQTLDEVMANDSLKHLSDAQKKAAHEAGTKAAKTTAKAQDARIKQKATGNAVHRKGTVKGDGVTIEDLKKTFNDTQNKAYEILSRITEVTGFNIVLYKSEANAKGKFTGAQGEFRHNDPYTIYLDINAGLSRVTDVGNLASYTMLRTFTHEFTHSLEYWNPKMYNELKQAVFAELNSRGENVRDLIEDKVRRAGKDKNGKDNLSYEDASHEVVAEALCDILPDANFVQTLAEKHNGLFHELLAKLKEFIQSIKDHFASLSKNSPKEARALQEEVDGSVRYLENIVQLFDKAAVGAIENMQSAMTTETEAQQDVSEEAVPVESVTRHSYRSLAEAAGFEAVENPDGTRMFVRDGVKVTEVTIDDIEHSPIGAFINFSLEQGDISKADADRQKDMFAKICTMACQTNDFAMTMQFVGSAVFTGMKANADKQYGTTYDFPSICTKTQAVIDAMSAKMVKLGRGLNSEEIVELYRKVFASGNPVPCPECYVFSRWIGIGGLLDNIKKYQDYYGNMAVSDVAAIYRKMLAEIEAYAQANDLTVGKAKGALTSKLTKEFNKLTEKIEKAQNQGEKVKDADLKRLEELEPLMNTVKAMTWLENVYFADEALTKVNKRFRVPNEVLFDLNNGEAFVTKYPEAWAFRTTQGAGYGKAITPYAEASLGEGILATNNTTNTIKGKANGTLTNYFLKQNGKLDAKARKALVAARKKQKNQGFIGGQRFQSTSDARFENASDYLIAALEMQAMHGMVQVYTKVDGAVPAFSAWGFSINQSLMPLGGGLDANGNVKDTAVGGMNPDIASNNRKKHETAGTITIGVNDNHIRAMLKQRMRDFIIPYHASGGKADVVAEFRTIQEGQEKRGKMVRSTDYSRTQSDKILSDEVLTWLGKTPAQIQRIHEIRSARIAILTRGKADMTVVRSNRFLSALYDKLNGGEWDGVKLAGGKVESQIFPNEFWDQTVSYEDSGKITRDYLEYCDDLGFLHRFSGLIPSNGKLIAAKGYDQNGERVQLTDLAYQYDENGNKTEEVEPFFWKVLTDRRMYDNAGNYLPQKVVTLNDTTTDTVTNFAKNNYGRQYNKTLSLETADRLANEGIVRQSARVSDESTLDFLNEQIERGEYITTYKSMRLDGYDANGNPILHSPMATEINGRYENEYELGQWYQATEHPELIKFDKKNGLPYFELDKGVDEFGDDLGKVPARYNPYEHSSNYVINDQFKTAFKRPNLVVVEMRIPLSETTSGYQAQYAKDPVGWQEWKKGDVASALAKKGKERKVFLSRWSMPVRILSDAEVAKQYKDLLSGTGVTVPNNVVTPTLLKALEDTGVDIDYTGIQKFEDLYAKKAAEREAKKKADTVRYSSRDNDYAPTFYSQMAKVVEGMKQEKFGAASVVSMLRGKGVKAEEIKWSGIEAWLDGKKSVTKAELLEFIAGSELQIEEETLSNEEIPYTADQQQRIDELTAKRDEVAQRLADEWKKITGDEFPIRNTGAGLESAVTNAIIDANLEKKKASFEGRLLAKLRKDLQKVIEDNDDFGFDSWKDALRSVHRHRRDFINSYEMSTNDKSVIVRYCNALNAYNEVPNKISDSDTAKLRDIAMEADVFNRKIGDVKSEHYAENAKHMAKWSQYKLKGGSNYRELLFKMPGSFYNNDAMYMHWDDRQGILVHARVQDFEAEEGKMLFVEEIQSDWHNEGHKSGYDSDPDNVSVKEKLSELERQREELREDIASIEKEYDAFLMEYWGTEMSESEYSQRAERLQAKRWEAANNEDSLNRQIAEFERSLRSSTPDAPFKDTYHEYVMKRLLREAAEQGYDSIGWTPAEVQVKRWSEEFAEGYRIEYDQDIPKFMNKYGKKWETTVGKTVLDNGTEVWVMPIPDSMKDSVLYEGQVRYHGRDVLELDVDWDEDNNSSLKSQITKHLDEINEMEPVTSVSYDPKTGKPYNEQLKEILRTRFGYKISRQGGMEFLFDEPAIATLRHYVGSDEEAAAAIAAPYVLKRGKIISGHKNHNNNRYPSLTFAAPARLNGKVGVIGVAVLFGEKDRVHSLRVMAPDGKEFVLQKEKADSEMGGVSTKAELAVPTETASKRTITPPHPSVNPSREQQRGDALTDREVLERATKEVNMEDLTDGERDSLRIFNERLQTLRDLQMQRLEQGRIFHDNTFKKDGDRNEAAKAKNRMAVLDAQIAKAESALLDVEDKAVLKTVLKKARGVVEQQERQRGETQLQRWRDRRNNSAAITKYKERIKADVAELNRLLLHGDKKKHVPENLKKAVAAALAMVNMDTVGADERIAKYEALIAKETDPDKIEAYTVTMENIRNQGEKIGQRLKELKDAYEEIANSTDPDIANAYDPVIAGSLQELAGTIGDTSLRDMTVEQLEDVSAMYRMVLTRVRDANKTFLDDKRQSISNLASRVVGEVRRVGGEHKSRAAILDPVAKFKWDNQKPVYAMEAIGSDTMIDVFNELLVGEGVYATDVSHASGFADEKKRKYKFNSWDFNKKYRFTSTSGIEFDLTLEQIMSLYAYSKRNQAHDHLRLGGFVFDSNIETYEEKGKKGKKGILKYKVNTADAHQLTPEILLNIIGKLSAEQRAFVDEMQDYLSTVMGAKGNEVTMKMYGVKLFKEKFYFPLKSAKQFMFEQNEAAGEVKIKNSGFTNKLVAKANNPIILNNFMDVWAGHVHDMSMYHSFVLPLEDFNRVFNYNSQKAEGQPPVSVKGTIQSAYGPAAVNYVKQLITDLNGGAVTDPRETIAKAAMSNFKKAAVLASASVVIQQPSAIGRATALVDSKYFIGPKVDSKRHKALWAEVKKYAPVAIIKEMGYFDTGMGRSAQNFIKGDVNHGWWDKTTSKVDDLATWAPAKADELTWCAIWEAVKRETKAKNKGIEVNSEAFLKMAGKRFTEVITKTQVYDSVLSRSGYMRSKSGLMNMMTSFMAEPTTTANMVEDALRKGKRGNKKYAARTLGAALASITLNALLSSLVYAARDDDEDETFLEKYLQSFATEMLDGINPLTYYPFLKDIWSALQGFDIERADMSLITRLIEATTKLIQAYGKDTSDMDEAELKAHQKDIGNAWWGLADYVTAMVGLPVKNVRRDLIAGVNVIRTIGEDLSGRKTTWGSLVDKVWDSVRGSIPVVGWLRGETAADKLYDATVSGDKAYQERLESAYETQTSLDNAIRRGLCANDSRIWEAAIAWNENNLTEYMRIAREIVDEGNFSQDNVVMAIRAEADAMLESEADASTPKAKGYFTMDKFAVAISQGNAHMANTIMEDIIATAQRNGKTAEEAVDSFESSARSRLREMYLDGNITAPQITNALVDYCGYEVEDAEEYVSGLTFELEHPDLDGRITYTQYQRWQVNGEPNGVSLDLFTDVAEYRDDGTSNGAKSQAEVAAYINSLPISPEAKDALWCCFWKETTLHTAPWN